MLSRNKTKQKLYAEKFSRTYLLLLLLLISILFFNVIKIFLIPILLAAVFTSLFYPLFEYLNKAFRGRASLSAATCCVILLLGMLIPIYFVAHLVSQEGIDLFHSAVPKVQGVIEQGDEGLLGDIKRFPLFEHLDMDKLEWQSSLQDVAKNLGSILTKVVNKTSKGTFHIITDLFITLFTMFYFFRDGHHLVERFKYLSPLDDAYEERLITRFVSVSRATIRGTLLIGLAQGTLGGLTLWICGVGSPVLWAVVMVILSVIPLVGAWLVLYPAALIQLLIGNIWPGIVIIVVTVVVIANVDTLLRPRLVGREAGMHDLMIFFSTLGGISVFGIMGFIVGPVIAVFFLTILDIYSMEFKTTLDLAQNSDPGKGVPEGEKSERL
ncbi:MAG: AI-2E family transporter [bacterium]